MSLKDITDQGIIFGTNLNTLKARNIKDNPHAATCFYFPKEQRQINILVDPEKTST